MRNINSALEICSRNKREEKNNLFLIVLCVGVNGCFNRNALFPFLNDTLATRVEGDIR